jgi:hypothetical protein
MTDLKEAVMQLLQAAGYEISSESGQDFAFIAQNQSALIFGVEVKGDLEPAVRASVANLMHAFQSKIFGPKTMEMYVIYLCRGKIGANEIEQCERDVRVCRKIVLTDDSDVVHRLSFLLPLEASVNSPVDPEQVFWKAVIEHVNPEEGRLLRSLRDRAAGERELLEGTEEAKK